MLLVFSTGLFGCNSSESTSHLHESRILSLKKQWEENPTNEQTLHELATACETALANTQREVTLDLLLADTLSNTLLRPDLGLPLFEAHLQLLNETQRGRYWSALLRAQKIDALTHYLEVEVQDHIPHEHPVAALLAHRAKSDRKMTWDVWLHELNGVVLFESAPVIGRRRVNRPITDFKALTTAMKILLPDWSIRMAIAEQRKPIDPDPDPFRTNANFRGQKTTHHL